MIDAAVAYVIAGGTYEYPTTGPDSVSHEDLLYPHMNRRCPVSCSPRRNTYLIICPTVPSAHAQYAPDGTDIMRYTVLGIYMSEIRLCHACIVTIGFQR